MAGGVYPRVWEDIDDLKLVEWLQRRGVPVTRQVVEQAIPVVADDYRYHPVREWLNKLAWDGTARLDFWLQGILGVEDSEYVRAVGSKFLISAVARVYQPGCKVDSVLIFEGEQGIGKSKALRVLFDPWFTDSVQDFESKDSIMQIHGVWAVELAELGALNRSETRRVKDFLSRTDDRYRPPYARHVMDVPRQCVFCGSSNETDYLMDPTGGRRFWPVRCGKIDMQELLVNREQIWAEAVARYKNDEAWYLDTPELIALAKEEQADRYAGDPWETPIYEWLHLRPSNAYMNRRNREEVTRAEIMTEALLIERGKWNPHDGRRISAIMTAAGWTSGMRRRDDGSKERIYWKAKK
jgi:predicted P-loop ATPase